MPVESEKSSQDDDERDGDMNQDEPAYRKFSSSRTDVTEGEITAEGE